mmetsp:Transcript_22004/g.30938  ORF Transcript_22004/g.30938 Transcript_22004/m.30938 type:complete len:204 (-) Transcript_22004:1022-1633(-)
MLTCAGFSNDTGFTDAFGKKCLSYGIIDFVCPSVCEVLTLEPNTCTTSHFCETRCEVKRCWTSHEVLTVSFDFGEECRVVFGICIGLFNLTECFRERLRDELTSKLTKMGLLKAFSGISVRWYITQCCGLVSCIRGLFQASTHVRYNLVHGFSTFFCRGITSSCFQGLKNGRSNNDTISNIGHSLYHIWSGDSKSNSKRKISL